jgi:hypothetical protein
LPRTIKRPLDFGIGDDNTCLYPELYSCPRKLFTRSRWYICLFVALVLTLAPQNVFSQTPQSRVLYGMVYSASTGRPVPATISVTSCDYTQSILARADGSWRLTFPYGSVGKISFSALGYESQTFEITLIPQWFYAGGTISLQPSTG